MFFPIRDENPRRSTPVITGLIIAACALVWIVFQGAGTDTSLVASLCNYGAIPGELTGKAAGTSVDLGGGAVCVLGTHPHWITVLTSMFLHGSWLHLIGNMWFLWVFGDNIEDAFGHIGYLVLYLFCGLIAAGTQIAINASAATPMVGASGAISGIMGAYIVLYPRVRVTTLVFLLIFITWIYLPAYFFLGLWFALQLVSSLPQLGGEHAGVAFFAHIGGFLAGALIAYPLRGRLARAAR